MSLQMRRELLKRSGLFAVLAGCGLLSAHDAWALGQNAAFDEALALRAASMQDTLKALGGIAANESQLVFALPELVENGAVVPISVDSRLPGTREIFIVVETNPHPLAARFSFPEGTEPFVATRIKLAQSGSVHALVRADGRLYSASRRTQVSIGGCG